MDKKEIERLILEEGLILTDLIDVVIDINGIVGVGLVTLRDNIVQYMWQKMLDEKKANDKPEVPLCCV